MEKAGYVYIMASGKNGTIYTGVTSDLIKRVYEHREGLIDGFTKRYGCKLLVWFEVHEICRKRESASCRSRNGSERGRSS
jgi:putative endonuclease